MRNRGKKKANKREMEVSEIDMRGVSEERNSEKDLVEKGDKSSNKRGERELRLKGEK